MRLHVRALIFAVSLAMLPAAHAGTGTISMGWDPVSGASGYRVYYGTESGHYDSFVDVGNSTGAVLDGLDDCTTYYASVKAYSPQGESAEYSNEVTGWARPTFVPRTAVAMQGNQLVLEIDGANFASGADLQFDAVDIPLDEEGNPLVVVDALDVVSCRRIHALVTVEPMARGFQAMQTGELPVGLQLRNPDGVFNTGSIQLDVVFNPNRADVNRRYQRTVDRVDGDDLAALARAWASSQGQDEFEFDCDLDGDTDVDGDDLALLATYFGHCRSGSTWSPDACL